MVAPFFCHFKMSTTKWRSHPTSSLYLCKGTNLDFIVKEAIAIYLDDFHDTTASVDVNTYPLVDFESFILDIQIVSIYSSSTAAYLV